LSINNIINTFASNARPGLIFILVKIAFFSVKQEKFVLILYIKLIEISKFHFQNDAIELKKNRDREFNKHFDKLIWYYNEFFLFHRKMTIFLIILYLGDGTPMDFWDFTGWRNIQQNQGLDHPKVLTPHLLHHINPNVKLIIILRNPTQR
jgi:hypothetical protein